MADLDRTLSEKTFTYEDLARCTQHFLAERPVIVLGTGATIPHGLPSMAVLADLLLAAIKGNPPGWEEFSACLDATKDLEQALHDVALPDETVEILVAATWEIISSKDSEFYEQLLKGAGSVSPGCPLQVPPENDRFTYPCRYNQLRPPGRIRCQLRWCIRLYRSDRGMASAIRSGVRERGTSAPTRI
ncbi:MAG: hypothetical protein A2Y79_08835 [Deltaproteobacteria bacterium RBG_13_43_22]|nr:MAG: hypothetical protein A2Y79_08835 [Deltaproteobacteria bacterium RBG_13_43_22]